MSELVKEHIKSAVITFLTVLLMSVAAAIMGLDKNAAWSTYLEAGSFAGFVTVVTRALLKVLAQALVPAMQATVSFLVNCFGKTTVLAKSLFSKKISK